MKKLLRCPICNGKDMNVYLDDETGDILDVQCFNCYQHIAILDGYLVLSEKKKKGVKHASKSRIQQ